MNSKTFVQRYLNSEVPSEAIEPSLTPGARGMAGDTDFARYLGFDDSEYARWVNHPESLDSILVRSGGHLRTFRRPV